jgi:hypothetical protein
VALRVCFGEPSGAVAPDLFCGGNGWSCQVGPESSGGWTGVQPFGGVLAGIATAAEVFRLTMRDLGTRHGLDP